MALLNVLIASVLMFLQPADLGLFVLLLGFAAVVSLTFGYSVATALMRELRALGAVAARLAAGDFGARVGATGGGEIARLSATFDNMADRLEAAFARERTLEASRRDLVAAFSHDLRTPLATTRAMIEALTEGGMLAPDEVRCYHELIQAEVRHLSRLIDDLFELSQLESGTLELQRVPVGLLDLVTETLAAYQARAREQGILLEVLAEPDLRPVLADPPQIQRVLRNLIDNALRYAPDGDVIHVEIRADGPVARVSVSDGGPGLAPDELERVFEPLYRGEQVRSRPLEATAGSSGAGLGLAIARQLVQAHGGRIWAEGGGKGAVFRFTLPFATE